MSLSFLVPAFLAGLAAIAVPVLIHLTRRQSRQPLAFPSLMFVRRVPHRTTKRRRIHRWPLLLLRAAALAALALAFARPVLEDRLSAAPVAATGAREVVVLLDRSYSMGYGDRWERARQAAERVIAGLGGQDRATLLLFDSRAEAAARATPDRAELRRALADARPGPGTTRYAPALRYAQRVLAASPLPRREVVVISDFQRSALQADGAELRAARLPPGTRVTPVSVADDRPANGSVASVELHRTPTAGRERVSVTARLTGVRGTRRAALEVDGRTMESRPVTAAADGSATVAFAPFILSGGRTARGTVRLEEDALPADDAFHFALAPDPRIGAVVVRGAGAGDVFLERALSLGDAPGFRTTVRTPGTLRAADLASSSVVILDQAPFPGGVVGERLQRHVEEGGGLIVVLGESAPRLPEAILPGRAAAPVDRSGVGGTTLGFVDFGHPVFAPFSTPRAGDFTAAHVYRYRPIEDAPGQRVLARFGDGATALAERRVGRGRVLLWASTLDDRWNDLALQPVFLPFLHEVVKYAAGYAPAPTSLVVGDPWDPGASRPAIAASLLLSPSGRRTDLEPSTPVTLEEPGFYQLRDRRTGAEGTTLAVNVDRSESALESFDPAELVREVSPAPSAQTRAGGTLSLQERERSQSGWWYLVILAFLLLAAETVLSNRLPRATAALSNGRGAV